jgi:hypothetical protein
MNSSRVQFQSDVWNQPSRYRTWGWGDIGFTVNIYAFEDGRIEDVSNSYK